MSARFAMASFLRKAAPAAVFAAATIFSAPASHADPCAANPFVCCVKPCPVFDAARLAEIESALSETEQWVATAANIAQTFNNLRSLIGTGSSAADIATGASAALDGALDGTLDGPANQGLIETLLADNIITGGYLSEDAVSALEKTAQSYFSSTIEPNLAAIAQSAIENYLQSAAASGPAAALSVQAIEPNITPALDDNLLPELDQEILSAIKEAISNDALGGELGDLQNLPAAIARRIANSVSETITSDLDAYALTSLPGLLDANGAGPVFGGPFAASPYSVPTVSAATAAVEQSFTIPTGAPATAAVTPLANISAARINAALDGIALAWHSRATMAARLALSKSLANAATSASTLREAVQVEIQAELAVLAGYATIEKLAATLAELRAINAATGPLIQPNPPLTAITSDPGSSPPWPGASAPQIHAVAAAANLFDAANITGFLAGIAPGIGGAIGQYRQTRNALASLTHGAIDLLGTIYSDPAQAFARVSGTLLAEDTTPWWDYAGKLEAELDTGQSATTAIAGNLYEWGTPIVTSCENENALCQFEENAPGAFAEWLEQRKYVSYWATLASQSEITGNDIANGNSILAYENGVANLDPADTPEEVSAAIAAAEATKPSPDLQQILDLLTSPNPPFFVAAP